MQSINTEINDSINLSLDEHTSTTLNLPPLENTISLEIPIHADSGKSIEDPCTTQSENITEVHFMTSNNTVNMHPSISKVLPSDEAPCSS